MTTDGVDIKLVGDEELNQVLTNLDYKTQHKVLKRVVNDAAQKTIVKAVKAAAPVGKGVKGTQFSSIGTGNLKRSIGTVSGKSKRSAVVFAGPRTKSKYQKRTSTNMGFVANIIEHGKNKRRVPTTAKALSTPWGPRKSVKGIPARPFVKPNILSQLKPAENHIFKSIRTIMEREMKKARKNGIA